MDILIHKLKKFKQNFYRHIRFCFITRVIFKFIIFLLMFQMFISFHAHKLPTRTWYSHAHHFCMLTNCRHQMRIDRIVWATKCPNVTISCQWDVINASDSLCRTLLMTCLNYQLWSCSVTETAQSCSESMVLISDVEGSCEYLRVHWWFEATHRPRFLNDHQRLLLLTRNYVLCPNRVRRIRDELYYFNSIKDNTMHVFFY